MAMNENEKVTTFLDMVSATDKLARPWRIALIVTNALWAIVFALFICLAYLTPDTSYQMQDFEGQSQVQSVGDVSAQGD